MRFSAPSRPPHSSQKRVVNCTKRSNHPFLPSLFVFFFRRLFSTFDDAMIDEGVSICYNVHYNCHGTQRRS